MYERHALLLLGVGNLLFHQTLSAKSVYWSEVIGIACTLPRQGQIGACAVHMLSKTLLTHFRRKLILLIFSILREVTVRTMSNSQVGCN